VLHLRNLDPTTTKEDLTKLVQPYCVDHRDAWGSVEMVTCRDGIKTGQAYVGFDYLGEADEALKNLAPTSKRIIGSSTVVFRKVKDKKLHGAGRLEARPKRSEKELMDSLTNWEQYVDPKDLEMLEQGGVSKDVLDEVFTNIRYNNRTFGPVDLAIHSERLYPEKEVGGHYRSLVQKYVDGLKACLGTPENPGALYDGMFTDGDQVDKQFLFDHEANRIEKLRKTFHK